MEKKFEDGSLSLLKAKVDALMVECEKMSVNISADEKYRVLKKTIKEGMEKAIINILKDDNNKHAQEELITKKEELGKIILKYFDEMYTRKIL